MGERGRRGAAPKDRTRGRSQAERTQTMSGWGMATHRELVFDDVGTELVVGGIGAAKVDFNLLQGERVDHVKDEDLQKAALRCLVQVFDERGRWPNV